MVSAEGEDDFRTTTPSGDDGAPPAFWRDDVDAGVRIGWSVERVREMERAMGDALTDGTLTQRAAKGLSKVIAREMGRLREAGIESPRVVVLVGPGNNGGDALYAARNLAETGVTCEALLAAERALTDAVSAAEVAGVRIQPYEPSAGTCPEPDCGGSASAHIVAHADIVVDGMLGIGAETHRAPAWQDVVDLISPTARVVAVDCPSPGVRADVTVTFGVPKTSLMLDPAAAGTIECVDIGLDVSLQEADAVRLTRAQLASSWPVPGPGDHKYTRGVVGLATGSDAFAGAAVLGAVAAVTAGAGMVRYVGPRRPSDAVTAAVPEAVHGEGRVQAWVVGSGIDGPSEHDQRSERYSSAMTAMRSDEAAVVDAGALAWLEPGVRPEGAVTVITPHAGELATLLQSRGIDVERPQIEADPVTWARRAADECAATVLLKGGVTVVAAPGDGPVLVENRAPHWLATAGTGDVLAGLLGVVIAAGVEPQQAAALAAYVHGRAAHLANPGGPVRALDVASSVGRAVTELITGPANG